MTDSKGRQHSFVSAVLYVRNNRDTIADFLTALDDTLFVNFEHYELICVNDSSNDGSVEAIDSLSASVHAQSITVINLSKYHGIEAAMKAGVDFSIGDFVFEFDRPVMDFAPEVIMEVFAASLEGRDIVSAYPSGKTRLSSRLFYSVFNRFSKNYYPIRTDSFRLLTRRAINRVYSLTSTLFYRKALYANSGLNNAYIEYAPLRNEKQHYDKSLSHFRSNLGIDSLLVFTNAAYRLSLILALIMVVISLVVIVYVIVTFATGNPIAGWASTMLFLSVGTIGVFTLFAVVIRYLSILLKVVFDKQVYLTESIDRFSK